MCQTCDGLRFSSWFYCKLARHFAEHMNMQIKLYAGMWGVYLILNLPSPSKIPVVKIHWLLHWVLAILSSAGHWNQGLIQFWFLSLSLLLLSFSLWFKQSTSASQLSICQFSWVLNTLGKKKSIYYIFTTEEEWMAQEIGNEPGYWSYRSSTEQCMLLSNSEIYLQRHCTDCTKEAEVGMLLMGHDLLVHDWSEFKLKPLEVQV